MNLRIFRRSEISWIIHPFRPGVYVSYFSFLFLLFLHKKWTFWFAWVALYETYMQFFLLRTCEKSKLFFFRLPFFQTYCYLKDTVVSNIFSWNISLSLSDSQIDGRLRENFFTHKNCIQKLDVFMEYVLLLGFLIWEYCRRSLRCFFGRENFSVWHCFSVYPFWWKFYATPNTWPS